jgi:hypothetical protein
MRREPLVEDIQNYALNIVDTVREPLLILDTTKLNSLLNQSGIADGFVTLVAAILAPRASASPVA